MTKEAIEVAISRKIFGRGIGVWRIGLTHDLRDRYEHWKQAESLNVSEWEAWDVNSLSDAQAIEADFINKGMQGGTGGNLSSVQPVFVYVFA